MASTSRLNKHLWTNVTRLKLMDKEGADVRFLLQYNPFDDVEEEKIAEEKDEYIIIGRVLPKDGIYKDIGFSVEMKLTIKYPQEPPIVRILTPVYHLNIENDGTFCHQLLNNASRWRTNTTLADVVHVLAKYLEEPDADYAVNFDMAREYLDHKEDYRRKAREIAEQGAHSGKKNE